MVKFTEKVEDDMCDFVREYETEDDTVKAREEHCFIVKNNVKKCDLESKIEENEEKRVEMCFKAKIETTKCEFDCECSDSKDHSTKLKHCICNISQEDDELQPLSHTQDGP